MEVVTQIFTWMVEYSPTLGPYAGIMLITFQIMNRFIKPVVKAHKRPDGYYVSNTWRYIRMGMVFYPMILGSIGALLFGLNVGYGIVSGAAAQGFFLVLDKIGEKKGVDVLPDQDHIEEHSVDLGKSMIERPASKTSLAPLPPKKEQ